MFHGKFHCIKTINVRKKNIVQTRPLTAEIKNNNLIPNNSVIRDKKNIRVVIYIRKNWCKVKCKTQEWGGMYQRYKNINLNK